MPNGRTHTAATVMLAVGTLPLANPPLTAGVLSGLILSPDLDVDDGFIGLAHLRRIGYIGGLLAGFWRAFWYPYSKIVPHRSHISHSVFFGTALRVGYLAIPLLALSFFVHIPVKSWVGIWFIGLCLSDALHIFMDYFKKG